MSSDTLRLLPLGGLGEIGMNCLVIESSKGMVLVDCGIQFPDSSYGGIDLLAPDFSCLEGRFDDIKGIVITHGHDDHIGAIPYLAKHTPVDVYCTSFPRGLIQHKLSEMTDIHEVRFHEITPRKKFEIAGMTFDPIRVQHSIIESLAFAIETSVGTLIHTGDFKHDPNPVAGETIGFEPFAEIGDKGVHLLLSDSTNAERGGHTVSENDITRSFEAIFKKQTGRIIIGLFASNIRRLEGMLQTAKTLGKKVAFAGRSMHGYSKLAHDQGSLKIPADTLVLMENLGRYSDKDVIVLATGSQAEPQSALVRIAQGVHKDIQIRQGDLVILSSRFIPGNERNIAAMIDQLYRSGAEVWYEAIHQIHVSGHGHQEELLLMLKAARPKFFIPVHGEYRHLKKHASLARQAGVPESNVVVVEDGQVVEVSKSGVKLAERVELVKMPIMDGRILEGSREVFHLRSSLSRSGVVFVTFCRDKKSGKLVSRPTIHTQGLLFLKGEKAEGVLEEAITMLEEAYAAGRTRDDLVELIRLETRRFFKRRVSHKPLVIPVIQEH